MAGASLQPTSPLWPRHGLYRGYDLVCCGHSHVAEVIRQPNIRGGETLLVNPGSVSGIGAPNVDEAFTWILGDLADMTFEIHILKY